MSDRELIDFRIWRDVREPLDEQTQYAAAEASVEAMEELDSVNWGAPESREGERTERGVDVVATHPGLDTLPAWMHIENPEGVFNPPNPDYGSGHSH